MIDHFSDRSFCRDRSFSVTIFLMTNHLEVANHCILHRERSPAREQVLQHRERRRWPSGVSQDRLRYCVSGKVLAQRSLPLERSTQH